jgi:hypothetical protein
MLLEKKKEGKRQRKEKKQSWSVVGYPMQFGKKAVSMAMAKAAKGNVNRKK